MISPLSVSPAQCNSWPGCWEPGPELSWSTRDVWAGSAGLWVHLSPWIWRCLPCRPWYAASWWQLGLATDASLTACLCLWMGLSDAQPVLVNQVHRGGPNTRSMRILVSMFGLLWGLFSAVFRHFSQVMKPWLIKLAGHAITYPNFAIVCSPRTPLGITGHHQWSNKAQCSIFLHF